jgi:ribosomal protein S18 acetylase RimI-like enzyme
MPTRLEVRAARPDDIDAVADLLAEASAWLQSKGIAQWPARFSADFLAACIQRGELFVAADGEVIGGTVTLQWSDPPFWGDRDDAGFVHRLAVRRSYAGSGCGRALLRWAEDEARMRGRSFLCLDTLSSNARLRRYYEDMGFRLVGEIEGPADHPTDPALVGWRAVLYEKAIGEPKVE